MSSSESMERKEKDENRDHNLVSEKDLRKRRHRSQSRSRSRSRERTRHVPSKNKKIKEEHVRGDIATGMSVFSINCTTYLFHPSIFIYNFRFVVCIAACVNLLLIT